MAIIKKQPFNKEKAPDGRRPGRPGGKFRKDGMLRKKVCRFCTDKLEIDYKNISLLRSYTAESGKILPARATGACMRHQKALVKAIKRARILAMLPFSANQ
ncbi:MAG: 30S ribosomal protein S18 [Elusimicrobiota bacterium]|jgi:small subunit ribosomal protein S18|nr:30S ribosomal protein S18 [Elusimicrobiota bacterium]